MLKCKFEETFNDRTVQLCFLVLVLTQLRILLFGRHHFSIVRARCMFGALVVRFAEPGVRGGGHDEAALPAAPVPGNHVGANQHRRVARPHAGDHAGARAPAAMSVTCVSVHAPVLARAVL